MSDGRSGQPDYHGTVLGPRVVPATHERRTTVLNDSKQTTGAPPANRSASDYGKFFPRGMRGILQAIQLYALGNAVGTVDVNISPYPGIAALYTTQITPPAAWGWVDAAFNVMWNYDSMYVWVDECNVAVFWGYDTEKPPDGHRTTDGGVTFTGPVERSYIRAVMTGETAGDVPVSGTVNVIEIPSIASEVASGSGVAVAHDTWVVICTAEGAGTLIEASLGFNTGVAPTKGAIPAAVRYAIQIYADGALAVFASNTTLTQSETAPLGRSSKGEFFQTYADDPTDGESTIRLRLPVKFRRSLAIRAYQSSGAATTASGILSANEIK